MKDLTFTYFFLNFICSLVFLFYGKILAQAETDSSYYKRALFPILTYAFVHGMRWNRMIDWLIYRDVYKHLGANVDWGGYEIVFANINHFFYNLGFPYFLFITLQCAFLMFCILVFMKNYREYLPFILPIMLATISANDLYIRWFTAFCFMLLAFNAMVNEKKILMWIFYLCSVGCHIGFILFVPLFLFEKVINKRIIPPIFASILLLATYFVFGITSASVIIVKITDFLLDIGVGNIDRKVEYYLTVAQALCNGTRGKLGFFDYHMITLILWAFSFLPAVWFARSYVDKIKYGRLIYNVFVVGAITTPIFCVEIFDRYAKVMTFFSCVACAVVFKELYDRRKEINSYIFWFIVICYAFSVWPTISAPWHYGDEPACGNNQMFVWEAK